MYATRLPRRGAAGLAAFVWAFAAVGCGDQTAVVSGTDDAGNSGATDAVVTADSSTDSIASDLVPADADADSARDEDATSDAPVDAEDADAADTPDVPDASDADVVDVTEEIDVQDAADAPDVADIAPDADAALDVSAEVTAADAPAEVADDAEIAEDVETAVEISLDSTEETDTAPDAATAEIGEDASGSDTVSDDALADATDAEIAGTDAESPDVAAGCVTAAECPNSTDLCQIPICKPDGSCGSKTKKCDDGNVCTDDSCNPGSGCVFANVLSSCEDGNVCTLGDACAGGVCQAGGEALVCEGGNACTQNVCNPTDGCVKSGIAGSCQDGNPCTVGDICQDSQCLPGSVTDCNDQNPCTTDSCDSSSGCLNAGNTASCDDGNACTKSDVCSKGICGGKVLDCNDLNVCTDDSCDPVSGCVHTANSAMCDDKNKCTTGEFCANKNCGGGTPTNCDDKNACTSDSCSSGCVHLPVSGYCEDGDACTANDYCQGGTCVSGDSITCDDGIACTSDSCDGGGGCNFVVDNSKCSDGKVCTDDSCQNGIGCKHYANVASCEDGNPCTVGDKCGAGQCNAGDVKSCADGNPCTSDSCDVGSGNCTSIAAGNGNSCDDLNACTISDVCTGGVCGGSAKICSDGNVCTDDSCDKTTGCKFANNSGTCADADKCTSGSHCNGSGSCVAGTTTNCDDNNVCTTDSCTGSSGACVHASLNSGSCDDGNACTTGEVCSGGVCSAALTVSNVSTISGSGATGGQDGPGSSASFSAPYPMARLPDGSMVVGDWAGQRVRQVKADGSVTTLAGSGSTGSTDGTALSATFSNINGLAVDANGTIFIADYGNSRIRKLSGGTVTTFAGSSAGFKDGIGVAAQFNGPEGIAFDSAGVLWVADHNGHRVRKITPDGSVSTVAGSGVSGYLDGAGTSAQFSTPTAITIASDGSVLVSDNDNYRIRRIASDGTVSTFAGSGSGFVDGPASSAKFGWISGLAFLGKVLVVVDRGNNRIRAILPDNSVQTLAGSGTSGYVDGAPSSAQFGVNLGEIAFDWSGIGWLADGGPNNRIRKITFNFATCNDGNSCTTDTCSGNSCTFSKLPQNSPCEDGTPCTSADKCSSGGACVGTAKDCDDGNGCTSDFCNPITVGCSHIAVANFTACNDNSVCTSGDTCFYGKCIASPAGTVSTIAGSGTAGYLDGASSSAQFKNPKDIIPDGKGGFIVADYNNHLIRRVDSSGTVSTIAGTTTPGDQDGAATSAQFRYPHGVLLAPDGGIYVSESGGNRIRLISAGGTVSTIAGSTTAVSGFVDGQGTAARFSNAVYMTFDGAGNIVMADYNNNAIRRITPAGAVTTIAGGLGSGGSDGPAATAKLAGPSGVAYDPAGNLYICELAGHRIRKLSQDGTVSTVLGTGVAGFSEAQGTAGMLNSPFGIRWHPAGFLLIGDNYNNRVRAMWADATNATVAGNGTAGYIDGAGLNAELNNPQGIAVAADGSLAVTDNTGNRIRKITLNQITCNDNNPCTADSCNPTTGACVFTAVSQGGGLCDDANPCTSDGCDANTGVCTHSAGNEGGTCTVNHTCGKCSAGVCGENLLTGSDEFNSTSLGSQWSIVNQDSANWSLSTTPGSLQLTALDGDIWGATNTAKNIFLQAAPSGSFEIVTRVTLSPSKNYQEAYLVLWQDYDNWVRLTRTYCSGCNPTGQAVALDVEKGGVPTSGALATVSATTTWLKLAVSGGQTTAFYSLDGGNWIQVGTSTTPSTFSVGLTATDVSAGAPFISANFDFFHVSKGCFP